MNIIDRYLGQAVIAGVFTVLIILTAVYAVFAFGGEVGKIGQADYTVWKAIEYSVYLIPQRLYEIFPLSMLLGTMLGLGWLANNNELVIIRLAGISLIRIIGSIMKAALMLMLLAIVIGEGIAPPLYQYASEQRIKALNRLINVNTNYGLWAKDGETFINVNRVESDGRLIGVTLYQFTENNFVERQMFAKQAVYDEQQWRLKSVTEIIYNQSSYIVKKHKELKWKTLLDLNMV
ncbi:MAG: LptF/LptG family permease, partial [Gammaproteobacteria bacterium]|nr:LptF/LptG family permease [Gammaproteobacteria bacterium]